MFVFFYSKPKCVDIMAIILLKNFQGQNGASMSHLFGGMCFNEGELQAGKVRPSDTKASPLG